ncbi:MAG: NAD(P)/FAD-dependent oxidoreductase [Oscillospiraceae bacterium]|nr:NAD(P)/FAD-dependent oxidoreductase [Oscillospiraceae bacterium]
MYDVIVIGAGPAGCTAAKTLAERGCKVLLTEKFKMPRYKSCSGQLIKKSIELVKEHFGEEVPAAVMCEPREVGGMIFTNDRGEIYRFEQEGFNVWRSEFDKWLAGKAEQAGAEVREGVTAVGCEKGDGYEEVFFKGENRYSEKARYVIDCEGAARVIRRKLTGEQLRYIMTYQTFNQGSIDLDGRYFYAYLQPELSEYDAWFNVKDNMLVLGVAVKDFSKAEYYYERFIEYMKERHGLRIEKHIKTDKWIMPYIRPGCDIVYGVGRVLFAGEAAGFLNPMGEGISAAIESGFLAARGVAEKAVSARAADSSDDTEKIIENYRESAAELHGYMRRQWGFVAGIADTFGEMKI